MSEKPSAPFSLGPTHILKKAFIRLCLMYFNINEEIYINMLTLNNTFVLHFSICAKLKESQICINKIATQIMCWIIEKANDPTTNQGWIPQGKHGGRSQSI